MWRCRIGVATAALAMACACGSAPATTRARTPVPAGCTKQPVHQRLANGGFEDPKVTSGSFDRLGPPGVAPSIWTGACNLGGWQLAGPLDLVSAKGTDSEPAEKDQFVDIDQHDGPAGIKVFSDIYQDVATESGHQYEVSVRFAANANGDPPVKAATLYAGEAQMTLSAATGKHTRQKLGWTQRKLTFTATGSESRIEIKGTTTTDNGLLLDDVQMRELPGSPPIALFAVAGAVALLLVGGGGFFIIRRRGLAPKLPGGGADAPGPAPQ
jgi:hypothetical protein